MNSTTNYNNNMSESKKVHSNDTFTYNTALLSKLNGSKSVYGNKIKITKIYVIKFLNYYLNRLKTDNNYDSNNFSLNDIVDDILKQLPLNKKMDRFEFYDFVMDYLIALSSVNLIYSKIASMIAVHKLHKSTSGDIKKVVETLYNNTDSKGYRSPLISKEYYNIVINDHTKIQEKIDLERDYLFDYFGIKTLERSYLLRIHKDRNTKIVERPQHMIMRVSIGIHGDDLDKAFETYDLISQKYFTHATPTLFNAGTERPQLSSCFLTGMGDSIESIFDTISNIANISKWSGGIGVHLSGIRGKGSIIRGTNGKSDGIIPLCIVLNWVARYINQGGKRKGSIACFVEPWHSDIFEFIELRSNKGSESLRARDLYLGLWVCDLFMERVESDGMWSLMCPDECPNLNTTYGEEFNKLYTKYESEGRYVKQVKALDLWKHIMTSHIETGFPYILYKDHANRKSNQKNLGTIRSSNLCAEIIEYSDENETAVCNLCSICLPKFVKIDSESEIDSNHEYDFVKLQKIVRVCVRNLNKIIDKNYYPTEKTKISNMKHRPMGIGVQGLADLYNMMGYPFESHDAHILNKKIFETIYYTALDESKNCAKEDGPYETFSGSPISNGILQYHMWGLKESDLLMGYDWDKLIKEIKKYGIRNSLLIALMPTASTSQIMGNSECIEPYMSNIFVRSTLAGDFIVINKNLMKDLNNLGLWTDDIRKKLLIYNGSIQKIDEIPINIKNIYKTAFETSLKSIVHQSSDRGAFVCQSQSLNLFIDKPNFDIINTALWTGWKLGLKTGMYYYRSVPAVNPIAFGIDVDDIVRLTGKNDDYIYNEIHSDTEDEIDINDMYNDDSYNFGGNIFTKLINIFPRKTNKVEECLVCGS
jgi:ribonucleoside-diphosphate reductase alpha subunit